MFLDIVNEDNGHAPVIILRSSRSPHHLENVSDGVVDVALRLPVEILRSLDDHQVGGEVYPPGQRAGGYEHLNQYQDESPIMILQYGVLPTVVRGGHFGHH